MKPDIVTSTTFWGYIATLLAASGAWFTYVSSIVSSRQRTYEGIRNLVEGLEAEFALISQWASGEEGSKGYETKTRVQLVATHPEWFNPSFMIFKFNTPRLNNITTSTYIGHLGAVVSQLVMLNHSIQQLLDSTSRLQTFAMGDTLMFQSVMEKLAPKASPLELALSSPPKVVATPQPAKILWTNEERAYINIIFMLNEGIHQGVIGGTDSANACLYKSFRAARSALQEFNKGLKREPLQTEFKLGHFVASWLAFMGLWEMMRWLGVW
jgi:hypothetical protein